MITGHAKVRSPSQAGLLRPAGSLPRTDRRAYHLVGIGGSGMSGLAHLLAQQGHQVTGSDMEGSAVTDSLSQRGINVRIGHGLEHLPQRIDCLVVSAAIKQDNPQWTWARQRGVPVRKYAELLGELSTQLNTLAVAGTHGKSTCSGWLAYMLTQAGREPSFVVGAHVTQLGAPSGAGPGEHLVAEACEYDRSFLNLRPRVAAILNIEADHLDYYRNVDEIVEAFAEFAALVGDDGRLIANGADEHARRAVAQSGATCEFFSVTAPANWQALALTYQDGHGCFDLIHNGRCLGKVKLSLPGAHNVANALAVAAMGKAAGLSDAEICAGLQNFIGVDRRISYKGCFGGVMLVDDYAHHPTEIRMTLEAIAAKYQPRRLWCVFQPHQHSRTRFLLDDFADSFAAADMVLLPDIYFVRDSEQSRRQINAQVLAHEIAKRGGEARYLGDFDRIAQCLGQEVRSGDLIVTMGAGDIWKLADELMDRFGRNRQA